MGSKGCDAASIPATSLAPMASSRLGCGLNRSDRRHERVQFVGRVRWPLLLHPFRFLDHERAKAELKALVPEDAKEACGHGVRAKRSKSGAVGFDLLAGGEGNLQCSLSRKRMVLAAT